jgi:hypothetical protein
MYLSMVSPVQTFTRALIQRLFETLRSRRFRRCLRTHRCRFVDPSMRPARVFCFQMLLVAVLLFKGTSPLVVSRSKFKPTSIAAIASGREHDVT